MDGGGVGLGDDARFGEGSTVDDGGVERVGFGADVRQTGGGAGDVLDGEGVASCTCGEAGISKLCIYDTAKSRSPSLDGLFLLDP